MLLVLTWLTLGSCLIGVGALVTHSGHVQGFDNRITAIVVAHRSDALNAAMKVATWFGSWAAVLAVAAALLVLVVCRRLSVLAFVFAVLLWGGTQGAISLAKNVVQRPRPPDHLRLISAHGWSWPSGHTATATLVFGILAAAVWINVPRALPRALAILGWAIVAVLVAFSRVELGVHWTTDVLASLVFAMAWLFLATLLVRPAQGWAIWTPTSSGSLPD